MRERGREEGGEGGRKGGGREEGRGGGRKEWREGGGQREGGREEGRKRDGVPAVFTKREKSWDGDSSLTHCFHHPKSNNKQQSLYTRVSGAPFSGYPTPYTHTCTLSLQHGLMEGAFLAGGD